MRIMKPVIWLPRVAGNNSDEGVRDFRPANNLDEATIVPAPVEPVVLSQDAVVEEGDPKASSAPESVVNSQPVVVTPTSPSVVPEVPATVAKVKLTHPSTNPGSETLPVVE
jgi:hypothetical protein